MDPSQYYTASNSASNRTSRLFITAMFLCAILALTFVPASTAVTYTKANVQDSCSRGRSELSCIMGCYKCVQFYGRKLYDMGSCCLECEQTQAPFIDNGPEHCSPRFFSDLVSQWRNRAGRK